MPSPDVRALAAKLKQDTYTLCAPEGRMVGTLCRWAGVKDLETRLSMDQMVAKLLSLGL